MRYILILLLYLEGRTKEIENQREINQHMKNSTASSIFNKRELKIKQINDENRMLKEQRIENEMLLKNFKNEEQNYNKKRAEEIKTQIISAKDKRKEIEVIINIK